MRVSELNGTSLDLWVSRANGLKAYVLPGSANKSLMLNDESAEFGCITYEPSKDWAISGPIIIREKISLQWTNTDWMATKSWRGESIVYCDESPLVAAMRCFVASRFGRDIADESRTDAPKIVNWHPNHVERRSNISGPRPNGVERRVQHHYRSY